MPYGIGYSSVRNACYIALAILATETPALHGDDTPSGRVNLLNKADTDAEQKRIEERVKSIFASKNRTKSVKAIIRVKLVNHAFDSETWSEFNTTLYRNDTGVMNTVSTHSPEFQIMLDNRRKENPTQKIASSNNEFRIFWDKDRIWWDEAKRSYWPRPRWPRGEHWSFYEGLSIMLQMCTIDDIKTRYKMRFHDRNKGCILMSLVPLAYEDESSVGLKSIDVLFDDKDCEITSLTAWGVLHCDFQYHVISVTRSLDRSPVPADSSLRRLED